MGDLLIEMANTSVVDMYNITSYNMDIHSNFTSTAPNISESCTLTNQIETTFTCTSGMRLMRYICHVVLTIPISVLGIVGNILGFLVWHRQKQSASTSLLLQSLAITDTLLLLMAIVLRSLRYIESCGTEMPFFYLNYKYIFIVGYPCLYIVRMMGTWITTLLTVNRWIAVCHPLHVQRLVTRRSVSYQLVLIIVLSILFSLPRFFEYYISDNTKNTNVLPTNLSKNQYYTIIYKFPLFLLFMYLLPMAMLIVFNTKLILALRRKDKDVEMLKHQPSASYGSQQKNSITVIVVTIVLIFLLCNFVALIARCLHALELAFPRIEKSVMPYRRYISNISNVMVTFNSAVNFLVYCLCSRNFRQAFLATFSRNRGQAKRRTLRTLSSGSGMTYMSVSKGGGTSSASIETRMSINKGRVSTTSIEQPKISEHDISPYEVKVQSSPPVEANIT